MSQRDLEVPVALDLKRTVEACRSTDGTIRGQVKRGVTLSDCVFEGSFFFVFSLLWRPLAFAVVFAFEDGCLPFVLVDF